MSASERILGPGGLEGLLVTAARGRGHQEALPTRVTRFFQSGSCCPDLFVLCSPRDFIAEKRDFIAEKRALSVSWRQLPGCSARFSVLSFFSQKPSGLWRSVEIQVPSPALQEGLPRGPCHVPAPPVCLQLVVTSTSHRESSHATRVVTRPPAGAQAFPAYSFPYCGRIQKAQFSCSFNFTFPDPEGEWL